MVWEYDADREILRWLAEWEERPRPPALPSWQREPQEGEQFGDHGDREWAVTVRPDPRFL